MNSASNAYGQQSQDTSHVHRRGTDDNRPVFKDLDTAAEQQQLQDVVNLYDFKMFGQGLAAGADAAPLPRPPMAGEDVLVDPQPVHGDAQSRQPQARPSRGQQNKEPIDPSVAATALADDQWRYEGARNALHPAGAATDSARYQSAVEGKFNNRMNATQPSSAIATPQQTPPSISGSHIVPSKDHQTATADGSSSIGSADVEDDTSWLSQQKAKCWHLLNTLVKLLNHMVKVVLEWLTRLGTALLRQLVHVLWLVLKYTVFAPLTLIFGSWYRYNRRVKAEHHVLLSDALTPDKLQALLGAVPSWLADASGNNTETLNWLNTMLAQAWPILDAPVCELIRTSVEPMIEQFKPPFISKLGFQKLTLGELPVVLEGIRVVPPMIMSHDEDAQAPDAGSSKAVGAGGHGSSTGGSSSSGGDKQISARDAADVATATRDTSSGDRHVPERIEFEVDFAWVGQPNISFFVELAVIGPYTRMVPRLSGLNVKGTMRLALQPLLPVIPGFGAALLSMTKSPHIKFTLDFGPALGGKYTAKPVASFLDPFLRDTLANLVVWPNRFVVPILPRDITGPLDDLQLRSRGVLQVEIFEARHLPKQSMISTVDPQIELFTQPEHKVRSSPRSRTTHPNWHGERLELLVQEPASQVLRMVVYDIELFNVKELLRVNLLKGAKDFFYSNMVIGRATIPLAPITSTPGLHTEDWYKISKADWAEEMGIDEDVTGEVRLGLVYKPFKKLGEGPISGRGVLFVDIRQAQDLMAADYGGTSDPYVVVTVAGQKKQTAIVKQSLNPVFNAHFEFFNVQLYDVVAIKVRDKDFLKPDDSLGVLEIPVKELLRATTNGARGVLEGWFELQKTKRGKIELKLQYQPYE